MLEEQAKRRLWRFGRACVEGINPFVVEVGQGAALGRRGDGGALRQKTNKKKPTKNSLKKYLNTHINNVKMGLALKSALVNGRRGDALSHGPAGGAALAGRGHRDGAGRRGPDGS